MAKSVVDRNRNRSNPESPAGRSDRRIRGFEDEIDELQEIFDDPPKRVDHGKIRKRFRAEVRNDQIKLRNKITKERNNLAKLTVDLAPVTAELSKTFLRRQGQTSRQILSGQPTGLSQASATTGTTLLRTGQ
jgi:hypothetical protein